MIDSDQRNRTVIIDECETSIFSDGSIIINTALKDVLCIDFHDVTNLLLIAEKVRDAVLSDSSSEARHYGR